MPLNETNDKIPPTDSEYSGSDQVNDYKPSGIFNDDVYKFSDYSEEQEDETGKENENEEFTKKENLHPNFVMEHDGQTIEGDNQNEHFFGSNIDYGPRNFLLHSIHKMVLDKNRWDYNCRNCWHNMSYILNHAHRNLSMANWNYEVNVTAETAEIFANETLRYLNATRYVINKILPHCRPGNWKHRRMEKILISTYGYAALDDQSLKKLMDLQSQLLWMSTRQRNCTSNKKVTHTSCDDKNFRFFSCKYGFDLKAQYNYWRMGTNHRGPLKIFTAYQKEIRKMAEMNNISDPPQMYLQQYESKTLWQDTLYMIDQLKPLYNELHCFIRRRLRTLFSEGLIRQEAMIPVYFIDTPWSENWVNLLPIIQSQKYKTEANFTDSLIKQNITVIRMVKMAEKALVNMGFDEMHPKFWNNSVFELPKGRNYTNFVCNPEAWNMYNDDDYRIKICAEQIKDDFLEVHRLLAGVEYSMQYKNQTFLFQRPPCEGLIEGIETTIELGASSPLYQESVLKMTEINDTIHLLEVALRKLPFLFHAVAADQWRWEVLNKKISPKNYNRRWWALRNQYEGVKQSEFRYAGNLDAAMKYRDVVMEPYLGHIFGTIMGFQVFREICIKLKEYDPLNPEKVPLHRCNIFKSKEVGLKLKKGMALGASKPWNLILEEMIGEQDLNVTGVIEYFAPLMTWLYKLNCRHLEYHSWRIFSNIPQNFYFSVLRPHLQATPKTILKNRKNKDNTTKSKDEDKSKDDDKSNVFQDGRRVDFN